MCLEGTSGSCRLGGQPEQPVAQADKAGALEALEAEASKLTNPEEVAHGKLYVKFASKALEKVRGERRRDLLLETPMLD